MLDLARLLERLNPFTAPFALLDIVLVALLFYWLLGTIRGTRAVQLLRGIGVVLVLVFALGSLINNLTTLRWMLTNVVQPALLVAIPILFQPELRRALERLGRTTDLIPRSLGNTTVSERQETLDAICKAAIQLSNDRTGGLIVIERSTRLQDYIDKGVMLDARITPQLLMNIFVPNTPLHDMAVVVRGNRIVAANVMLPLSDELGIRQEHGTRHRAAKGITEHSDAIAVVVSEETGSISLVVDGRMLSHLDGAGLRGRLSELLRIQTTIPLQERKAE